MNINTGEMFTTSEEIQKERMRILNEGGDPYKELIEIPKDAAKELLKFHPEVRVKMVKEAAAQLKRSSENYVKLKQKKGSKLKNKRLKKISKKSRKRK